MSFVLFPFHDVVHATACLSIAILGSLSFVMTCFCFILIAEIPSLSDPMYLIMFQPLQWPVLVSDSLSVNLAVKKQSLAAL